jgi:hypothetical protein
MDFKKCPDVSGIPLLTTGSDKPEARTSAALEFCAIMMISWNHSIITNHN